MPADKNFSTRFESDIGASASQRQSSSFDPSPPDLQPYLLKSAFALVALGIGLSFLPPHKQPLVKLFSFRDIPWLMILGAVLGLSRVVLGARWTLQIIETAARRLEMTTLVVSAIVFCIGLCGTFAILHGFSLSRDEAMAQFDATIIAQGHLIWPLPTQWRPYADALEPVFRLPVRDNTGWISSYLPVNAAIRAAFGVVASPVLAAPTLAALSVIALMGIGQRLWPKRPDAVVVTIVVLASSIQFLMTSMTAYAMTAHLALNLVWLWLFLRGEKLSHLAAVFVGVLATGLHQLVFHPLFAAPFIVSLWVERRFRLAVFYTGSYALIMVFWIAYWQIMLSANGMQGASTTEAGAFAGKVFDLIRAFEIGDIKIMIGNIVRFITWQNPLLLPLVLAALVNFRTMPRAIAVTTAGIVMTFVMIFAVLSFQGHGWGYRYFHGLLGSFALLTGHGWIAVTSMVSDQTRRKIASQFVLLSFFAIFVMLPARAYETEAFVAPFAKADDLIQHADSDVVFVDPKGLPYASDLVRNDPLLRTRPLVFDLWSLSDAQIRTLCAAHDVSVFDESNGKALNFFFQSSRFLGPGESRRATMTEIGCGRPIRRTVGP